MYETYEAAGVKFFALNVPRFSESATTLAAFANQAGLSYPVMDHSGTQYAIDFAGTNGFPYPRDVVVGRDGTIIWASTDYDGPALEALLQAVLAEDGEPQ